MTKNIGNARYMPPRDTKVSLFSKVAPAVFPLVVAANRDEFFARPAAALDWWTPAGGAHEDADTASS